MLQKLTCQSNLLTRVEVDGNSGDSLAQSRHVRLKLTPANIVSVATEGGFLGFRYLALSLVLLSRCEVSGNWHARFLDPDSFSDGVFPGNTERIFSEGRVWKTKTHLEKLLQLVVLLVSEVEETMPRMMCVETQTFAIDGVATFLRNERQRFSSMRVLDSRRSSFDHQRRWFLTSPFLKGRLQPEQKSKPHWTHLKCMQPPRLNAYRNLHSGHWMPFSSKYRSRPTSAESGSYLEIHRSNSSQDNVWCSLRHWNG